MTNDDDENFECSTKCWICDTNHGLEKYMSVRLDNN